MFTFWRKYKCCVCTKWLVIYVLWIMPVNSFSLWGLKWIKIFEKSNGCWYSVISKEFSADKAMSFTCWTNKNKIMAIFTHTHKNNPRLKTKVCKWDYFVYLPLSNVINIVGSAFICILLYSSALDIFNNISVFLIIFFKAIICWFKCRHFICLLIYLFYDLWFKWLIMWTPYFLGDLQIYVGILNIPWQHPHSVWNCSVCKWIKCFLL